MIWGALCAAAYIVILALHVCCVYLVLLSFCFSHCDFRPRAIRTWTRISHVYIKSFATLGVFRWIKCSRSEGKSFCLFSQGRVYLCWRLISICSRFIPYSFVIFPDSLQLRQHSYRIRISVVMPYIFVAMFRAESQLLFWIFFHVKRKCSVSQIPKCQPRGEMVVHSVE